MDRLNTIIAGLRQAGGGGFSLALHDDGQWMAATEFGREAPDSPMAGGASYGMGPTAHAAVDMVLAETRWGDLPEDAV